MHKHTVLYRPVIAILACALAACCGAAAFFDIRAFYVTGAIAAAAFLLCLLGMRRAQKEVERFIAETGDAISSLLTDTLINFPLPIIAAKDGEITWYNRRAGEDIFP